MGADPDGHSVLASAIGVFNIVSLLNPGLSYKSLVKRGLENLGNAADYEDGQTIAASLADEYKVLEEVGKKAKLIKQAGSRHFSVGS